MRTLKYPALLSYDLAPSRMAPLKRSFGLRSDSTTLSPPPAAVSPKKPLVRPPHIPLFITSTCALIVTASLSDSCGVSLSVVSTKKIWSSASSVPILCA